MDFLLGKPGGGKTLRAVWLIVQELLKTDRVIVTNVALLLGPLQAYLWKLGYDGDVKDRIRILTPEETREWPLYRGWRVGVVVDDSGDRVLEHRNGRKISWPDGPGGGVCFVIDEVHHIHNSRRWQETGAWALWYCTQHRQFDDNIYLITQALLQVDRQLRGVAQGFVEWRNLGKETWYGFAMPSGRFMWREYLDWPGTAVNFGTATLNRELAGCYRSRRFSSVAVEGEGLQDGNARRGRPLWIAGLALVAVTGLLAWAPWGLGKFAGSGLFRSLPVPKAPVKAAVVSETGVLASGASVLAVSNGRTSGAAVSDSSSSEVSPAAGVRDSVRHSTLAPGAGVDPAVFITARAEIPGRGVYLALSDGRVYSPGDGRAVAHTPSGSLVEGVWVRLGTSADGEGGAGVGRLAGAKGRLGVRAGPALDGVEVFSGGRWGSSGAAPVYSIGGVIR